MSRKVVECKLLPHRRLNPCWNAPNCDWIDDLRYHSVYQGLWHASLATSSNAFSTIVYRVKLHSMTWRAMFARL